MGCPRGHQRDAISANAPNRIFASIYWYAGQGQRGCTSIEQPDMFRQTRARTRGDPMSARARIVASAMALGAIIGSTADAAELTFLHSIPVKAAVDELIPSFETASGNKVSSSQDTSGAVAQQMQSGEPFDVVIATSAQIANLEKQGIVANGTKRDVAKVGLGVYVRRGAPRPDVSTVESFRQTLLKANSIGYLDPASGAAGGIYISNLLQRLGIADELKSKSKTLKVAAQVFDSVASGQVDLGMGQLSEIVTDQRVELAGMLPREIQLSTVYAVGVSSKANAKEAATALARFLSAPASESVFRKFGFEAP
jgi:molybdate transport system substrate-binding protein